MKREASPRRSGRARRAAARSPAGRSRASRRSPRAHRSTRRPRAAPTTISAQRSAAPLGDRARRCRCRWTAAGAARAARSRRRDGESARGAGRRDVGLVPGELGERGAHAAPGLTASGGRRPGSRRTARQAGVGLLVSPAAGAPVGASAASTCPVDGLRRGARPPRAARARSPWPSTHSGSGPSSGRPVKNFAAMQPPRHESKCRHDAQAPARLRPAQLGEQLRLAPDAGEATRVAQVAGEELVVDRERAGVHVADRVDQAHDPAGPAQVQARAATRRRRRGGRTSRRSARPRRVPCSQS